MTDIDASTLVHRLLFHALTEIRDAGHTDGNKLVYHLANLFHNASLQMERASQGRQSYEEILQFIKEHAEDTGCDAWVTQRLDEIEARVHANAMSKCFSDSD